MHEESKVDLVDLNTKVPVEWHKVIKVACVRINISMRDFLLMSAARMLEPLAADPIVNSVMPIKNAWSVKSEQRLTTFISSITAPAVRPSPTPSVAAPPEALAATKASVPALSEYLAQQVARKVAQGKTLEEIATQAGCESPKILQMFIEGRIRIPLDKAVGLARALEVQPAFLFRQAIRQYWDADEATLDTVLGESMTADERDVLDRIRRLAASGNFRAVP
jgi:hypothetical protein